MSPSASCSEVIAIAPAFNPLSCLEDLCESLSWQEYQGRKWVVFVNDGSSDGSVGVLEEVQQIEGFEKTVLTQKHGAYLSQGIMDLRGLPRRNQISAVT